MCLEKASPLHIQALGIILCTATGTGKDARKLIVYVQTSYVMLDCAQVRIATLSKRYCICVLCNNSINLYSICSAVCTLSGVFHNIIIIIIMKVYSCHIDRIMHTHHSKSNLVVCVLVVHLQSERIRGISYNSLYIRNQD